LQHGQRRGEAALSETEPRDYFACVVLLIRKEAFYVLEVVRGRFSFETLKRKVRKIKASYGNSTLLIEDSPISRGLIQSLREKSINVTPYGAAVSRQQSANQNACRFLTAGRDEQAAGPARGSDGQRQSMAAADPLGRG
jgi:phage terminase large subunit-like protein